jgi:hypothetical protein
MNLLKGNRGRTTISVDANSGDSLLNSVSVTSGEISKLSPELE